MLEDPPAGRRDTPRWSPATRATRVSPRPHIGTIALVVRPKRSVPGRVDPSANQNKDVAVRKTFNGRTLPANARHSGGPAIAVGGHAAARGTSSIECAVSIVSVVGPVIAVSGDPAAAKLVTGGGDDGADTSAGAFGHPFGAIDLASANTSLGNLLVRDIK